MKILRLIFVAIQGGVILNELKIESIYRCPICLQSLIRIQKQYVCAKGHNFDIAHNNYINLLIDNQKKSKDPGDNKAMMESRKNFLNKGYYSKFSCKLNEAVDFHIDEESKFILDAGCGEGYFLSNLKRELIMLENRIDIDYYGIDISKSAIKYASKRDKNINFAVGSNFNLPIINNSVDCIIRNFAPGDNEEFYRVLKEGGKLFIVTPGTHHLFELKEALYKIPREHEIKDQEIDGFQSLKHYEIKYNIKIDDNEDITNLISMTPYYWSITNEMRNSINQIPSLETTLHFNIDVYSKK